MLVLSMLILHLLFDPSRCLPEGLPIDLYNIDLESEHTSVCLIREFQDQLNMKVYAGLIVAASAVSLLSDFENFVQLYIVLIAFLDC